MYRCVIAAFLCALLIGSGRPVPIGAAPPQSDSSAEHALPLSPSWPANIRAFLTLESSTPVFDVVYRYGEARAASNGAYGGNVSASRSHWYVETQRAGAVDIIAGVLHRNAAMIEEGLSMLRFALNRENGTGAFPGSAWPFHGTAFFLSDVAPALVFLKYSPMSDQFAADLQWQTRRIRLAARHLISVVGGVGRIDDRTKNHRFYEAALALGASGVLAGDAKLVRWSQPYLRTAMGMQRPDGVMPEDGGHDTGYQALGMVDAVRYLTLVAARSQQSTLRRTLQRGEQWELSRVRRDGTIDQSGDTRTTGCQERDTSGSCKTTFYATIANALARWSALSGISSFERAAYLVWLQNWQRVPGDVLPPAGLWVRPAVVHRGQWLAVWGTRFQPLERVTVTLAGHELGRRICDMTGSFGGHSPVGNIYVPLPSLTRGTYRLVARGSFGTVRSTMLQVS